MGLLLGTAALVVANDNSSVMDTLEERIAARDASEDACDTNPTLSEDCALLEDVRSTQRTLERLAAGGFLLGGLLATATGVMLGAHLVEGGTTVAIAPSIDGGGASLTLQRSF
jgi:hypothetical protein